MRKTTSLRQIESKDSSESFSTPDRVFCNSSEIEEIVNRIVDASHPEQVLLFGSTARGTTGPHSDLDFLVIKAGRYNARKIAGIIYQRMRGIARSIDLVIVTPQQVEEYKNSPFSVVYPAVREGRVMYERKKTVA